MNYEFRKIVNNLMDIDEFFKGKPYPILNIHMFEQTWASTALGFGGMGGQAITTAMTYVIETTIKSDDKEEFGYLVFFGGQFAYAVKNPTDKFKEDLAHQNMASCIDAKRLY